MNFGNLRNFVAVGIACVLAGLFVGYLLWGQNTQQLSHELVDTRTRLDDAQSKLMEAESRLKKVDEDLRSEQERRRRLELVLSEGRK